MRWGASWNTTVLRKRQLKVRSQTISSPSNIITPGISITIQQTNSVRRLIFKRASEIHDYDLAVIFDGVCDRQLALDGLLAADDFTLQLFAGIEYRCFRDWLRHCWGVSR